MGSTPNQNARVAREIRAEVFGGRTPVAQNLSLVARFKKKIQGLIQTIESQNKTIAAQQEEIEKLKLLAATDELTGLPNRQGLMTGIIPLASKVLQSYNESYLGVIALDIDRFSKVNDLYGHPVGDKALQKFARISSCCVRSLSEGDIVARMGGEEFLVLVPPDVTEKVADRICETVRVTPLELTYTDIHDALGHLYLTQKAILEGDKNGQPVKGKDNQPLSKEAKAEVGDKIVELDRWLRVNSPDSHYSLSMTVSAGTSFYRLPVFDSRLDGDRVLDDLKTSRLYKEADSALAEAKNTGRDRVVVKGASFGPSRVKFDKREISQETLQHQ